MIKDLTQGRPTKLLFFFAMPMILGNLFQQFYNMVDSIVVAQFVGQDALAAVGSSFPVIFLAVGVALGMSIGGSVVISQLYGAKYIREMKTTVNTAILAMGAIGITSMIIGQLMSSPILHLLGTDPDVLADSLIYLKIYFKGSIFLFLYNSLRGIFNALGDSKTPLFFLIISTLSNIVLDLTFVLYLHQGVEGVAWATLIAQGMSAVFSFFVLMRRLSQLENEPETEDNKIRFFKMSAFRSIAKIGVPSVIQESIVSVGMVAMQGLVNSYGKVFVAGYTAANKIDSLARMPSLNFAHALSTYTAQNVGAGRYERVNEGCRAGVFMIMFFSIVLTLLIFPFGSDLLKLFLKEGTAGSAMGYGSEYLRVICIFYVMMGAMFVGNGMLRGAGDMGYFLASSLTNFLIRVLSAYLLSSIIGRYSIYWSIPIGWSFGTIITFVRIKGGKWGKKKVIKKR